MAAFDDTYPPMAAGTIAAITRWDAAMHTGSNSAPPGERYEQRGIIGQGGMGVVERVYDRELCRFLARKTMRRGLGAGPRAMFMKEAILTARLAHPGVIPILDHGLTPEGLPYYLMPEMRWKTLYELVRGEPPPADRRIRHRVEMVRDVADIVGFAHAVHGVVHCDLKSANVLVGDHAEVIVLDWGLAWEIPLEAERGRIRDVPGGFGTPGYMPPEQEAGHMLRIAATSDVFALGRMLYAVLLRDEPDLVQRFEPGRLPAGLDAVYERATAPDPAARFPDGRALATALRDWLDGVYRRERAMEYLRRAATLEPMVAGLRRRAEELRAEAAELTVGLPPWAPTSAKAEAWAREDDAEMVEREAAEGEAQRIQALTGALAHEPDLPEALDGLAAFHQAAHFAAEARGDLAAAARHAEGLRATDRTGAYAAYLVGDGVVSLVTDPPGADVWWDEYVEIERRLVPVARGRLGATPLHKVRLPRGSHRLRIRARGCQEVVYPVAVGRAEHWDGVPPGESEALPIWLPPLGTLGPDDCYVPAGWFRSGGDGAAPDGLSPRRLWIDAFVLRKYPVTVGEYFAFLNALVAEGRAAEAMERGPRMGGAVRFATGADGVVRPAAPEGVAVLEDEPVAMISWMDASAYAAWAAERQGRPLALPHDQEVEKAARGVDGRPWPWGRVFEPTWTAALESSPGPPSKVPVRSLTADVSPFGVVGLAGNCRTWCVNLYEKRGPEPGSRIDPFAGRGDPAWRALRGGQWSAAALYCRADARFVGAPEHRFNTTGLRLLWRPDPFRAR